MNHCTSCSVPARSCRSYSRNRAAGTTTMRRLALVVAAALSPLVASLSTAGAANSLVPVAPQAPVTWEQWQHLEGVVDIAGPRSDGNLVAMAAGRLYLVSLDGAILPFATDADGYAGSVDAESYLVVAPSAPALTVLQSGCTFTADDVFILDFRLAPGIARVDAAGRASSFAALPNTDWLFGIVFDTTGDFGHRLLVAGTRQDRTVILAIDCLGGVTTVTDTAPFIEGGLVVAPADFGAYGGNLIAPDELSGQIWAIAPDGTVRLVILPELPAGGDIGVESLGFVPPGFNAGDTNNSGGTSGMAYLADRGTPGNPLPGTDNILRLSSAALVGAGVQDGDLLAATEGGGTTVAIRCAATCTAHLVADGPAAGHIEGRITLVPASDTGR